MEKSSVKTKTGRWRLSSINLQAFSYMLVGGFLVNFYHTFVNLQNRSSASWDNQRLSLAMMESSMPSFSSVVSTIKPSPFSLTNNVPIVIISSLRTEYLERVMKSIQNQHPNTPPWISTSPRYVFAHRHPRNDKKGHLAYKRVVELAENYNYTIFDFHGLYNIRGKLALNANFMWYKMMKFLFLERNQTTPNATEALILEDDVVLAPDALLVAAKLLQEKQKLNDVHYVCLGGVHGYNNVNPDPHKFLAKKAAHFHAMAYSVNISLFYHLWMQKKDKMMDQAAVEDWTTEIVQHDLVPNLTLLTPSTSRMFHIGAVGMGAGGDGRKKRENLPNTPAWKAWTTELMRPNKTMDEFYLDPLVQTDYFGFVCEPLRIICHARGMQTWESVKNGPHSIAQYPTSSHPIPARAASKLEQPPIIPVVDTIASSSMDTYPPHLATDGDLFTLWRAVHKKPKRSSRHGRHLKVVLRNEDPKDHSAIPGGEAGRSQIERYTHKKSSTWIRMDLGALHRISSITIHWESNYASEYNIVTSLPQSPDASPAWRKLQQVTDGIGMSDFFYFPRTNTTTTGNSTTGNANHTNLYENDPTIAQFVTIDCLTKFRSMDGYAIWDIEIRGTRL